MYVGDLQLLAHLVSNKMNTLHRLGGITTCCRFLNVGDSNFIGVSQHELYTPMNPSSTQATRHLKHTYIPYQSINWSSAVSYGQFYLIVNIM